MLPRQFATRVLTLVVALKVLDGSVDISWNDDWTGGDELNGLG